MKRNSISTGSFSCTDTNILSLDKCEVSVTISVRFVKKAVGQGRAPKARESKRQSHRARDEGLGVK